MDSTYAPEALIGQVDFLRALARRLARDLAGADDAVQDTLAESLAASSARPAARPGALRGFLATVLTRRLANERRGHTRRLRRERRAARPEAHEGGAATLERLEETHRLVAHVEALPPLLREALVLRYLEDLPPRAIAARLGVPVATVKARLERALVELRRRLEADGGRERWLRGLCAIGALRPRRSVPAVAATVTLVAATALGVAVLRRAPAQGGAALVPVSIEAAKLGAPGLAAAGAAETRQPATQSAAGPASAQVHVLVGYVEDLELGAAPGAGVPARGVEVQATLGQPTLETTQGLGYVGGGGRATRTAQTDVYGRFSLELPAPPEDLVWLSLVVAGDERRRPARWSTRSGGDRPPVDRPTEGPTEGPFEGPVVLTRHPWGDLTGTVLDAFGQPIEGVPLTARGVAAAAAVSDEHGQFRFERLRAERPLVLDVSDPGWVLGVPAVATPLARGGFEPVEVVLARPTQLTVRAVDERGAPRAGEAIGLMIALSELGVGQAPLFNWHELVQFTETGTDGVARFTDVPAHLELMFVVPQGNDGKAVPGARRRGSRVVLGTLDSSAGTSAIVAAQDGTTALEIGPWDDAAPWPETRAAQGPVGAEVQLHATFEVIDADAAELWLVHDAAGEDHAPRPLLGSDSVDDPQGWNPARGFERRQRAVLRGAGSAPLGAGPCYLGATGLDVEGRPLTRVGTGPVDLMPGELHVRFVLGPTGVLRGRVGDSPGYEPCVALRDGAGRAVPLPGLEGGSVFVSETGAGGRFVLPAAPLGELSLWVGTREELDAGAPRDVRVVSAQRAR
ncbi:MAG: RNA polymerase sigma factor [Planctomycetota bacterium]